MTTGSRYWKLWPNATRNTDRLTPWHESTGPAATSLGEPSLPLRVAQVVSGSRLCCTISAAMSRTFRREPLEA
jgi:hypothetical protein